MTEYKVVKFKDIYLELEPMFQEHWEELGHRGGFNKFRLDIAKFMYLEDKGLLAVTVAIRDGKIIAYTNFLMDSINHNADKIGAYVDAMYVAKEYRNSIAGIGYKLLKFSEKALREQFGVGVIQFAVNINYDVSGFLKRVGYVESETIYIKKIGE